MRRFLTLLMSILLMVAFAAPVLAATEPIITQQPQNPTFGKYGTATYSVTVYGDNLQCNWYLHFNGVDYNISSAGDGTQPWEAYAGDSYGPEQTVDGEATVFRYNFYGIGEELSGCYIYAVIEDGHFEVISDKAYINVVEGADRPPNTIVPTGIEACKGDIVDIYCSAFAVDGSELTYLWYETATGELMDIVAVNRGSEDGDTEIKIQLALEELIKGRTTIVVAHRLSTLRGASHIAVIENGRITERGSHEELMKQKGTYYRLATIQIKALSKGGIIE